MLKQVENRIIDLHCHGVSFVEISRQLNIPAATNKSYVYRHLEDVAVEMGSLHLCPQCGGPVPEMHFKPRRFCSDRCRVQYWKEHRDEGKHPSMVPHTCAGCHDTFMDYAGRNRRYCSHSCYIQARFGGGFSDKAAIQE